MVKSLKDVNSFKEKIASALNRKKANKIKFVNKKIEQKSRPVKHHTKHIIVKSTASIEKRPIKHHAKHIEHKRHNINHPQHHLQRHIQVVPPQVASHKINHHKHHKTHHIQHHEQHKNNQDDPASYQNKKSKWSFNTDKDVAMDFATKVHRLFDHLIKATVLFGSQATGDAKSGSDIDLVILIDDAAINWDLELTSWYREELAKLIANQDYGRDLHVNTIRLTTWWRDLLHGDPVVLNILRLGQVLIDLAGFFSPIKALLMQGKIHATPEAVYGALQRAPQHLTRSKLSMLGAIEGIYWCMVESAQAALITLGKLPPSPEHVTKMLHESFVETGVLKPEYVKWYRDVYILHKQISHGEIRHVEAKEIEAWQKRAEDFMKTLVNVIDKLIDARNKSV